MNRTSFTDEQTIASWLSTMLARIMITARAADYNAQRPHSATDCRTPADYARTLTTAIADRRKHQPGAGRGWIKVQWQVTGT